MFVSLRYADVIFNFNNVFVFERLCICECVRSCVHARALPDEMESRLVHDVQNCKGLDLTLPCRHLVSVNAHKIILNNNY